ncbi:MAG: DUF2207 domain-containing protein, partial [Patescibacteria group bacterium]
MKFCQKIFLTLFIALLFIVKAPVTLAKSFLFPNVDINVQINTDGRFSVVEKRTFHFDGSFTKVFWDIPLRNGESIDVQSFGEEKAGQVVPYNRLASTAENKPEGNYAVVGSTGTVHIEGYHSSENVDKTFVLVYTVNGGIKSYKDVSDFYWKVIGENWGERTNTVNVKVSLPGAVDNNQINVWGHGPLNGKVSILDGYSTLFTVSDVPAYTFVEVREAFPSSILTLPIIPRNHLDTIRREEKSFQLQTRLKEGIKKILLLFLFVLSIVWAVYWAATWKKYGQEYKTEPVPNRLSLPPSKLQPALVESLINQEEGVTPNSFAATVLSLAQKRYLKIEAVQ